MAETAVPKSGAPASGSTGRLTTYAAFWPFYLGEHSKPRTRSFHFLGSGLAILFAIAAIVTPSWWFLLAAVVSGYFFAWISHFFIEHNKPATFTYPLWSLYSDFRMLGLWLAGRLDGELKRHSIA